MTTWTSDELTTIGAAEELQITSRRRDGTLRKPVTIWVVRHGDDLYVRTRKTWNGRPIAERQTMCFLLAFRSPQQATDARHTTATSE